MQSQGATQASATTEETHRATVAGRAVSELLEDAGNRRQSVHQVLKLLPLSDSLVSEQQKLRVVLDWADSFLSSGSDLQHKHNELGWNGKQETEHLKGVAAKSGKRQDSSSKSNDPTDLINEGARSKGQLSDNQKEPRKQSEEKTEDGKMRRNDGKMSKTSSSAAVVHTHDNLSRGVTARTPDQMAKPTSLQIPSNLTVYEQYQLCVDQLHHLRAEKDKTSSEDTAAAAEPRAPATSCLECNSTMKRRLNEVQSRRLPAAETTQTRPSDHNGNTRETPPTNDEEFKPREPAGVKAESRSLPLDNDCISAAHLDLNGNNYASTMNNAEADEHFKSQMEQNAALAANPGIKGQQGGVKGHKTRAEGQGQRGLSEHFNRTDGGKGGMLPRQQMRPQSAGADKYSRSLSTQTHTKRPTLQARVKHTPPGRPTHTCLQPARTYTRHPQPAGVPVCDWLLLPDEVWLTILSLLSPSDLCKVVPVCSRLHTLATDHTLWRRLRIENSTLTELWLLSVGKHRPHTVCLSSCSSCSVTTSGLEMFFILCRNTLKEVSVTGCMGPGLHGDHILTVVGKLCDHVTHVDVSWSGATDRGVKALGDGGAGLRLTSIVLNGCHITDDPLKKLVTRHKQSLCRLEVFGCQFLTATCLQTVYEMCPGLKHLNIGQVPKVNKLSLTVMTSRLKSLLSLNLTGLKAVTDAVLDTLLQNCASLQSLTLSSCPGVTDLTLHSISKYTPRIRSIDVSGCKAITDVGVQSLTLGCKGLQQLNLSSTGTGSRGISLLASYCSQHLHTVKLSFCHISIEDMLELCRRCRRLRVLHLYGCAQLPTEKEISDVNSAVKVSPLS